MSAELLIVTVSFLDNNNSRCQPCVQYENLNQISPATTINHHQTSNIYCIQTMHHFTIEHVFQRIPRWSERMWRMFCRLMKQFGWRMKSWNLDSMVDTSLMDSLLTCFEQSCPGKIFTLYSPCTHNLWYWHDWSDQRF